MAGSRRTIAIVLGVGLAAWLVGAALIWLASPPLGHDESQYAIAALDLVKGRPVRWEYLSIGMNAIAIPGVLAGGGEIALRAMPVVIGLLFVLAAARLARIAFGEATAAWTVAVLAASFAFVRRAAELLSDLPAAACLLAGAGIIAGELARKEGVRWRLVLAAPCLAAAFYLRYGSALAIAAIGGAAVLAGWRPLRRRPAIVVVTAGAFAVLLVPHFAVAIAVTGSAMGIFRASSAVLGEATAGTSLVTYVTSNPFTYYGIVTAPVMLAGLAAIWRWRDLRVRLLWLMAVGDLVAVGLTPIPAARYIFFGLALLVILGVEELRRWVSARGAAAQRVLGAAAAAAIAASWVALAMSMHRLPDARVARMQPTLRAVAAIREDARGAPCEVIGRHTTQLEWYTGCTSVFGADAEALAKRRVYLVYEPGSEMQPQLEGMPGVPRRIVERPEVIVIRYDPDPAATGGPAGAGAGRLQ